SVTDLREVDRRYHHQVTTGLYEPARGGKSAADLVLSGNREATVLDDRSFGGRAAHVEGDHIGKPEPACEVPACRDARRWTRTDDEDRPFGGRGCGHSAAVRPHNLDRYVETDLGEANPQSLQVSAHNRLEV